MKSKSVHSLFMAIMATHSLQRTSLVFATFSFSVNSTLNACGPLNFTWTGASGQATLIDFIPVRGTAFNVTIPTGSSSSGSFVLSQLLNVAPSTELIIAMKDTAGNYAVSPRFQVSSPVNGDSCDTSTLPDVFYFGYEVDKDPTVSQCSNLTFGFYVGGPPAPSLPQFPVTIRVYTLAGTTKTLILTNSTDQVNVSWIIDLPLNAQFVLTAFDALGRAGGASTLIQTIIAGDDDLCLSTGSSSVSLSKGELAGIIIGSLVGLGVIAFLLYIVARIRRRRKGVLPYSDHDDGPPFAVQNAQYMLAASNSPATSPRLAGMIVQPFQYGPHLKDRGSSMHDDFYETDPRLSFNSSQSTQRKPDSRMTSFYSTGSSIPARQVYDDDAPPDYQNLGVGYQVDGTQEKMVATSSASTSQVPMRQVKTQRAEPLLTLASEGAAQSPEKSTLLNPQVS